jgi:2-oxoisovalerate dehydrogenase E1 component
LVPSVSGPLDEYVVRALGTGELPVPAHAAGAEDAGALRDLLEAQLESRHLDLAQRWLQAQGQGFYTIGSAGHESNAAVAMALRPTDPALLHYRSGGFYSARAAQVPGSTPVEDVLNGSAASVHDPISGGRHKVFGNADLAVIPQTSTIGSHLPRAVGLAFALGQGLAAEPAFPPDAVVVCSFGDASANHSTTAGALNAAGYCAHRGLPLPILFVCEDNGIGISVPTPRGWTARSLASRPGIEYVPVDGTDPVRLLRVARELAAAVRAGRRPAVLHLRTVRFLGHAGSDAELAYRPAAEIAADYAQDPLLATAAALVGAGAATPAQLLERYEEVRAAVMSCARTLVADVPRLSSAREVTAPLDHAAPDLVREAAGRRGGARAAVFEGRLPEDAGPLTLAQAVNAALHDVLAAWPQALVFGEDVGRKGGVYGLTRGLQKRFGRRRVFDTLLDEQTILGTALGAALAGCLPIPEIQYLAYLHNAEDQLRGEAASLRFFSAGRYQNGMVVRIAGLPYQKGFGGHFHNDNSVAVLRDVPGLVLAVPGGPAAAPGLLRECVALAAAEGRVCVFLEPIALYHEKDLYEPGDGAFLAPYPPPGSGEGARAGTGRAALLREGADVLLVTFGNGVRMSLRAARRLAGESVACSVLDLRWLAPLPVDDLVAAAHRHPRVLVVDETRFSGGVSEGVVAALVDAGHPGRIARVTSADSFVPLGPAAGHVLVAEDGIVAAVRSLLAEPGRR